MGDCSGSTSSLDIPMVCRKSLEPKYHQCCFSVKPAGYQLFLEMGHACNGAAAIYLGKHIPTSHFVAIRQVPLEQCDIDIDILKHEIIMHKVLDFENILTYLSTFIAGRTLWIVMPLQGYGSCRDIIHAHFQYGLPETAIALILRQILNALVYLHEQRIIHRAIRASHFLVSSTGVVVLTGLRDCYKLQENGVKEERCYDFPVHSVKSLNYLSPDVLAQNLAGYDQKSDIYSIGIVACELANGHPPFTNMTPTEMLYEKINGHTPRLLDQTTVNFAPSKDERATAILSRQFSNAFHDFAEICCNTNPNIRPTAEQLLEHGFFKQVRKVDNSQLPALLRPLNPLTESLLSNQEHIGVITSLTHELSSAAVKETFWDF